MRGQMQIPEEEKISREGTEVSVSDENSPPSRSYLWSEKYRPKTPDAMAFNQDAYSMLKDWLLAWTPSNVRACVYVCVYV